jgi:uncharacterized protein (TIGR03086 family)
MPDHDAFQDAVTRLSTVVHAVGDSDWSRATPCADWDVRALLHHTLVELLWVPPLVGGLTLEEVGDRFDGDVMGSDPLAAWDAAARQAADAFANAAPGARQVHTSQGLRPMTDYLHEMTVEMLVHRWDLARGLGGSPTFELEELTTLEAAIEAMAPIRQGLQDAGILGPAVTVPPGADRQARVLASFGRAT